MTSCRSNAEKARVRAAETVVAARKRTENAEHLADQIVTQHTSKFIKTGYNL